LGKQAYFDMILTIIEFSELQNNWLPDKYALPAPHNTISIDFSKLAQDLTEAQNALASGMEDLLGKVKNILYENR
jgi:hypothetical protein